MIHEVQHAPGGARRQHQHCRCPNLVREELQVESNCRSSWRCAPAFRPYLEEDAKNASFGVPLRTPDEEDSPPTSSIARVTRECERERPLLPLECANRCEFT